MKSTRTRIAVTSLFCAGLLSTFSRGPWLAAVVIYFAYAALDPRGISRVFKAAAVFLLLGAALLASPIGDKISGMIPFMGGTVDTDTLNYRERLLDRSWELIKERPILGDQLALSKMEDLRQGQGIIDVVNAYVGVTLFYGFTGLAVFLTFILTPLARAYRKSRRIRKTDLDSAFLGTSLAAAIVAMLLLLADSSLGTAPEHLFYIVIGLAAPMRRLPRRASPSPPGSTPSSPVMMPSNGLAWHEMEKILRSPFRPLKFSFRSDLFSSTFTYGSLAFVRLGSSLILTRLLTPTAYGLFAILLSFAFTIEMLSDVGPDCAAHSASSRRRSQVRPYDLDHTPLPLHHELRPALPLLAAARSPLQGAEPDSALQAPQRRVPAHRH